MPSLRALSAALLGACCALIVAPAARCEVPDWVPEKYRGYFVRHVDERPAWKRALDNIDVAVGNTGRSFALIAGVSRYPNMSGRAADLAPAKVDVAKMAAYLAGEPESFNEIVVLAEDGVTAENMRYFLTNYFPRRLAAAPRSRFLFAYSGHGTTAPWGEGFLLTRNARTLDDRHSGISLDELRVWFQSVVREGHQVLALINACYGAAFHRLPAAFGPSQTAIPRREGAHAITAGGSGELTWHDPTFGEGSLFFEAVLAALDGRADRYTDGVVTFDELQAYLRNTISGFTDSRQNPIPGDLRPKGSPGGFFFLDRRRQVERHVVRELDKSWWRAFGAPPAPPAPPRETAAAVPPPRPEPAARHATPAISAAPRGRDPAASTWNRTFGGSASDYFEAVVATPDGGVVAAGGTEDGGAGGIDSWLLKVGPDGSEAWRRAYGERDDDSFAALVATGDGGFAAAGEARFGIDRPLKGRMVRVDAGGREQWRRTYEGHYEFYFDSLAALPDGGFALGGSTWIKSTRGMLVKVDEKGAEQGRTLHGDTVGDFFAAQAFAPDGGFAFAGNYSNAGAGWPDGWLVTTDPAGVETLSQIYGGAGVDRFHAVVVARDGGFVLAGATESAGAGGADGWLVKVDANGNEQWSRTFGGAGTDKFAALVATGDGGYLVAGVTESAGAGGPDGWLVKVDGDGKEQWSRTFGGAGADKFAALAATGDGFYVLAGSTESSGAGGADGWLVKVDSDGKVAADPSPMVRSK